jgi:hypothetical protein
VRPQKSTDPAIVLGFLFEFESIQSKLVLGFVSLHMSLSEIERKRCEKEIAAFLARRRPLAHLRDELDIGCRIDGRHVEIFEVRPKFNEPAAKLESPIAKATFVRTKGRWRVFWMRQDLKWHSYAPKAEVNTLKEFLNAVDRDEHFCFWG